MGLLFEPNHIHLIAAPGKKDNLGLAIEEAHRRYTRRMNFREGWRGHLWQERFSSFVMDERYLPACTRYIENNPVHARLVENPEQWRWSIETPKAREKTKQGRLLIYCPRIGPRIGSAERDLRRSQRTRFFRTRYEGGENGL